jgi:alanine racemase
MPPTSTIEINLGAIDHNMRLLRQVVGRGCRLCPVVKADAYGLGATRVGRRLEQAGADMFAVYSPDQAAELIAAAISASILVLMPVRDIPRAGELYRALICGRLHLAVADADHLDALTGLADRYGVRINLHVEVDCGLGRGGCAPGDAAAMFDRIRGHPRLTLAGLFTHFSSADGDVALTDAQMAELEPLLAAAGDRCIVHTASTFSLFRHRRFHHGMVRVGMAWVGYARELMKGRPIMAEAAELRPSVTWTSQLIQVKHLPAGSTVGYGRTWRAERDSVIGLVPVGYADGYPHALSGSRERRDPARVAVLGPTGQRHHAPVVGAVNMDQISIDLTDAVASSGAAAVGVGAGIELISPDPSAPNHLVTLARQAGTLPHDLLCGLSPRLRRVYVDDEAPLIQSMRSATTAATAAAG